MLLEQPGVEQTRVERDELVEAVRRPPLPVDGDTPHPGTRDRRVELVGRTVGSRHLADCVGDKPPRGIGIVLPQIPPGELHMLAVAEALASRQDLMHDRLATHQTTAYDLEGP